VTGGIYINFKLDPYPSERLNNPMELGDRERDRSFNIGIIIENENSQF
jgi:hypothetical protein